MPKKKAFRSTGASRAKARIRGRVARQPTRRAFTIPKYVIMDNGGSTADRYTVYWTVPVDSEVHYFGMDADPYHPQGIGQHGTIPSRYLTSLDSKGAWKHIKEIAKAQREREISLDDLPPNARKAAESFIAEFEKFEAKPPVRIHTTRKAVYHYDDLDEHAKEKALEKLAEWAYADSDWWFQVKDDAENVGVTIGNFDIDRGSHCDITFNKDAVRTADLIVKNWGEKADGYSEAFDFLEATKEQRETIDRGMEGFSIAGESSDEYDAALRAIDTAEEELSEASEEFQKAMGEVFLVLLRNQAEWLQSREQLEETIRANEYEYDEQGNML